MLFRPTRWMDGASCMGLRPPLGLTWLPYIAMIATVNSNHRRTKRGHDADTRPNLRRRDRECWADDPGCRGAGRRDDAARRRHGRRPRALAVQAGARP